MSGFQDINILLFIEKYKLENFIETGCFHGDGLLHAHKNGINKLYSCDILDEYCQIAKSRVNIANLFCQPSSQFLTNIKDLIQGSCLIWLDAHLGFHLYGSPDSSTEMNFPLLDECEILSSKYLIEKDVILIDDIRIIDSTDNPLFQPNLEDKYKMKNITIKQILDYFPNHNYELVNFAEGILILTPK